VDHDERIQLGEEMGDVLDKYLRVIREIREFLVELSSHLSTGATFAFLL
jgi:hypothetical protein